MDSCTGVLKGMKQGLLRKEEPAPGQQGGEALLSASDLGLWPLGQFGSVAEVNAAIAPQPVKLEPSRCWEVWCLPSMTW
jgi:penicillin V acylase-like amidase (Ntn superfamily)